MKTSSFSLLLALAAASGAEAFAPSGSSFLSTTRQQQDSTNPFLVRGGAQLQLLEKHQSTFRRSSSSPRALSASVVRGGADDDSGNLIQSLAGAPLTKAILSSTLFVFTDMLIKNIFKAKGVSFPSSLAGCCVLAATLLASPFHERLYRILNPGAKLMQKFMMIFLVPNLIVLPLCGGSYSALEVSETQMPYQSYEVGENDFRTLQLR